MLTQAINNLVGVQVKGVLSVSRYLEKTQAHAEKSLNTAVRVEGFRLRKLLQHQIRQGAPGGKPFEPLSYIARRLRKRPNRKPLERMAVGIRYNIVQNPFRMEIGWVGNNSRNWRRLGFLHQGGFESPITDKRRKFIISRGGRIGKVEGGSTPFFLRKTKTSFRTPSRPIIEPFWDAEQNAASMNIARNFKLKLKGQRI